MKRISRVVAIISLLLGIAGLSGAAGVDLAVQELDLNPDGAAYELHADSLGRLWVSDYGAGQLWRYDPDQDDITVYHVGGSPADAHPLGADTVWWVESTLLGRLDTAGSMHTWEIPGSVSLYGLTIDSSGLIWLAESDEAAPAALYSFDPTSRDLCPYSLPEGGAGYYPEAGGTAVWLGDVVNERIVRLESASGVFTTWQLPAGSAPEDVALDRDGMLWYTETNNATLNRLDSSSGVITVFDLPGSGQTPGWITAAGGLIWFSEQNLGTFGFLNPDAAAGVDLDPISADTSDPYTPDCQTLEDVAFVPVETTQPDPVWTAGAISPVAESGGWQIYQLPEGGYPWGVAVSGTAWVVDWNRQKLVRTPLTTLAPLAAADAYSTDEDSVLSVSAPGVLANDSDPDGDPLTAVAVSGPAHGVLTLNADGSFTYTPDADYSGADTFTYQADNGDQLSNVATVTITVDPVNDAPAAVDDAYATMAGEIMEIAAPGVLANDSDPDGDPLTAVAVSDPAHGNLTLDGDGSFIYAPDAGFSGTDYFTYQADDGEMVSNTATVTITVGQQEMLVFIPLIFR